MADLVATIVWLLLQLLLYRCSPDMLECVRRDHGRAAAIVVLVGIVGGLLTSGPLIWWLLAFTPLPSPVTPAIALPFSTPGGLILGILWVGLPLLIARRRHRHSPIALPATSDPVLAVALDVALTQLARWSVLVPAVLAVYAIRPGFLAVRKQERQGRTTDGLNGQDRCVKEPQER